MNKIKKIWNSYREIITHNCTDHLVAETSLSYWQNRLFAYSIIYIIPLSLVALIPGIYMALLSNLAAMIAVDFLAMVTILSVAFIPGWHVYTRKLLFNGVLYITSATLLIYLGSFGPGLLYLLGITIFIVLSLDKIYGYIAVGLNILICIVIGIFIYFGWGNFEILSEYGIGSWIAVSSNLVFLSAIAVFLIPILFEGLQSAIISENNLRSELEIEQGKLQEFIKQLEDKNEELEHFAYTVSHDLKEPLRMIRSFMELLEKKYGPQLDNKAKEYIHFAVDGARRLSVSINDLLEYSRVGRLYTNKAEIDSEEVVTEILSLLSGDIESKRATIQVSPLPTITGFPLTFKMLVQNLITNALKYQPEGQSPEIQVEVKEMDTCWQFAVKDNGIGIDKEHHEEIFSIFKRLHTREIYQGSGMGLAIAKKITEQHGGEIWVESSKDKGSSFYFTIKKESAD